MAKMYFCSVLVVFISQFSHTQGVDFPALDHILPSASNEVQVQAVKDLISRKTQSWAEQIDVKIDQSIGPKFKDTFKLEMASSGKLSITGTSGVAASMGYYYYLSQYCHCHISWAGDQLNLPQTMPKVETITVTSNDRFRYYQNVCTVSYSFVWWNWTRWEREIDWMAMSGINMPLAFNGQEAIWQRVYSKMGFSDEVLGRHFGGPAFLAWARMGNLHGWGGPLTSNWHQDQVALQHKILTRMRSLGMIPVLPAFAGHVPENFKTIFPNSNVSKLSDWGRFNDSYCCTTLLEVTDSMFPQIGKSFIEEYTKEFGTDHLYNTDTFNEMTPRSSDLSYLSAAGKAVYQGLTAGDSQAVWVMQGWLFQSGFWTPPRAKALLTSVPMGRMIVLDLYSEVSPKYNQFESYYGQPFIWCMLHNFGGTVAMYGALDSVNKGPFVGRQYPSSTMIGTGLTPEGINQNDVVYEFMNEQAWRKQPRNVSQWMSDYSMRRYGMKNADTDAAWQMLKSVYNCTTRYMDFESNVIMTRKPRFDFEPAVWYDPNDVFSAWDYMKNAALTLAKAPLFRYDYVDVVRQSLQLISIRYYDDLIKAYKDQDLNGVKESSDSLLMLLTELDELLQTDPHFLLGRWISDAKQLAHNDVENKLYEFNARNQVTLWGPSGQILDYANKQWAGLVKGYYLKRWLLFTLQVEEAVLKKEAFNESQFNADVLKYVEEPFQTEAVTYTDVPIGDTIQVAEELHRKYRPITEKYKQYFGRLQHTHTVDESRGLEAWSYKYSGGPRRQTPVHFQPQPLPNIDIL